MLLLFLLKKSLAFRNNCFQNEMVKLRLGNKLWWVVWPSWMRSPPSLESSWPRFSFLSHFGVYCDCWPDKHLNIFFKNVIQIVFYIDLFIVRIPSQNCWLPEDAFFIKWNILQENKHLNIYMCWLLSFVSFFIKSFRLVNCIGNVTLTALRSKLKENNLHNVDFKAI